MVLGTLKTWIQTLGLTLIVIPWTSSVRAQEDSAPTGNVTIGYMDEFYLKDGKTPSWGSFSVKGFRLGLQEALKGSPIKTRILEKNVSRSPIEARDAAKALLTEQVDIVVGLREDGQALMAKAVLEGHIPFVTTLASSDQLSGKNSWTVSMVLRNSAQIVALVDYLLPRLNGKKELATVVTQNCTYCKDMNKRLTLELRKLGIQVKEIVTIMHGSPIAADVFGSYDFHHTFIGLFTDEIEALSLLKLIKAKGYKGTLFGGDSWPVPYLGPRFNLKDFQKMCLVNSLSFDSDEFPAKTAFKSLYRQNYSSEANDLAAIGFDTGTLIGTAIDSCKGHLINQRRFRECLRDTVKGRSMNGASGDFQIDSDGARLSQKSLLKTFGSCL